MNRAATRAMSSWPSGFHMVKELRRKGVTLQLLWEEYLREHPDGYQNSQFCHHWRKSAEVGMHIDHKAGEKLFVDYAGDRLAKVDADSGKGRPVETFVAILGASELTYVEASASQQSRLDPLQRAGAALLRRQPAGNHSGQPAQRRQPHRPRRAGHQSHLRCVRRALRAGHHARPRSPGARQGSGRKRGTAGVSTHLRAVA